MRAGFLLLTAFLLVGLSTCNRQYNNIDNNRRRTSSFSSDDQDNNENNEGLKPFQAGYQYDYKYNGQIASGLDTNVADQSISGEAQQKAVTRIQAQAKIVFQSERRATLRLQQIRVGQLNKQVDTPEQVQPMGMFEKKPIEEKQRRQLEMPCQFEYNQGVVGRVQFQEEDNTWSRNIKRSVLNLIQLNLKQQSQQQRGSSSNNNNNNRLSGSEEDYQDQNIDDQQQQQKTSKTFTLPEITIEGDCQTTYTINKNSRQGQYQSNEQQQDNEDEKKPFNVTKSINFKQCKQIADVAFGYQTRQPQPECAQCEQQWKKIQQQLRRGQPQPQQQQQQPNPCAHCDPKQIKEQKLDRSTVLRFVLTGRPEKYAIERAELISQYVYKNLRADTSDYSSAMQTVVAAELVFQNCQRASNQEQQQQGRFRAITGNDQQEQQQQSNTLLFDNQWDVDEKRFFMYGDEKFSGDSAPFSNVPNKAEQAQQILRKLVQVASDKTGGIEFDEVVKLQRLVEIFRMCTVQELKQIHSAATGGQQNGRDNLQNSIHNQQQQQQSPSMGRSESEQQKTKQILADALAIAGTKNTMVVLAEKITNGQLQPVQALQALKSLSGLVAPSDSQVHTVLKLCKSQAVHRSASLKQTCWLTLGSMVGELCQQQKNSGQQQQDQAFGAQTGFKPIDQMCSQNNKQVYKQALEEQYEQAENSYEKILALKALGNAGIDTSVARLEKIINNRNEDRLVRSQAIDSLRRLRTQMPRKIQRILLPIFQNTREHPVSRMCALHMIMRTQPEQPIVDQITYTLTKEANPQVQSFVYTTMKALSKSKVPAQQQLAKHLKSTLKIANVDEQVLRGASRKYQMPVYSKEQKEGVFLNLISAFSGRNTVPTHLAASLDTLLNEEYEMDSFQVSVTQMGMEQWYETLIQNLVNAAKQSSSGKARTRGQRSTSSRNNNYQNELKDIFSSLKITRRQGGYRHQQQEDNQEDQQQQQSNDQQQRRSSKQPFGMICVRIGDVDQAILPIDQESMPECLKGLMKNGRFSMRSLTEKMADTQHFRIMSALNLAEKSAKVPTSIGIPLRILQAVPILTSIEGNVKLSLESANSNSPVGIKAQVNLHPSGCAAHIQKMESWLPIIATGVESTRAIEWNAPIQAEVQADTQQGLKVTLQVPQAPKTRILGMHSLPSTYTRDWDVKMKMLREPKVKAIHNAQLEQLQRDVDKVVGEHAFGMPFRLRGHCHSPAQPTDYKQLLQLLMATENHLHLTFEPKDGTPKQVVLKANAALFQKSAGTGGISHAPELDNFYSNDRKFEKAYPEDNFEDMQLDNHEQRRQKLNTFLGNFRPGQMYQHSVKLNMETRGGRKHCKAQMDLKKTCDAKFKFCKLFVDVERTPIYANENTDWTLKAKTQWLLPDSINNINEDEDMYNDNNSNNNQQQQQQQGQKNRKLVVQSECEWGSDHKQSINVRVQAEQAMSRQQRQLLADTYGSSGAERNYRQKQSAFLNKFDVVAEYKLQPAVQNTCNGLFELVKTFHYWSTESQWQQSGRDGRLHATMVIDPIGHQQANISVKTPTQTVRIQSVQLPIKARPFALVRPADKASHSANQLIHRIAVRNAPRAECSVDGKRVDTFDGVLYKAPVSKCYSVLAKDCGSDQPRFVVLMKALSKDRNNQDKKIKVITPEQTITCQPSSTNGNKKRLECKINGQTVQSNNNQQDSSNQQQQEQEDNQGVVEYNNDDQTDVTINVEGVQVRFGCICSTCQGCQKTWIKISNHYKNTQCGLCGHYDDQANEEDELRMPNNKPTDNLADFHRSFSLQDNEECSADDQNELYSQKQQFGRISNKNNKYHDQSKKSNYDQQKQQDSEQQDGSNYQQDDYNEDQWQAGGYNTDSNEEDQWRRSNSQSNKRNRQMSKLKSQQQQRREEKRSTQQQQRNDEEGSQEPVEMTKVVEFNHKICFSVQPVKQCPEGTSPADEDDATNDANNDSIDYSNNSNGANSKKMQFACLPRSSVEARRLQRQARRGVIVDLPDQSPSFVEAVSQPTQCVAY